MNGHAAEHESPLWGDDTIGEITLSHIEAVETQAMLYDQAFVTQDVVIACEDAEKMVVVQDCTENEAVPQLYDPDFVTQEVLQVCENVEVAVVHHPAKHVFQPSPERCSTPDPAVINGLGNENVEAAAAVPHPVAPQVAAQPQPIYCSGFHVSEECGRCGVVDPDTPGRVLCEGHIDEDCQSLLMEEPDSFNLDDDTDDDDDDEAESIYSADTVHIDRSVATISSSMEALVNGDYGDGDMYYSFDYSGETLLNDTPVSMEDDDLVDLDAMYYFSSQDVSFEDAGGAFNNNHPQEVHMGEIPEEEGDDTVDLVSDEVVEDEPPHAEVPEDVQQDVTIDLVTPETEGEAEDDEEETEEEEPSIILETDEDDEDDDDEHDGDNNGGENDGGENDSEEMEEEEMEREPPSQSEEEQDPQESDRSYEVEEAEDMYESQAEEDIMEGDNQEDAEIVQVGAGGGPLINKISERPRWFEKFQTHYNEIQFEILPAPAGVDFNAWIYDVIMAILEQTFVGIDDADRVGLEIEVPENVHTTPFCIAIRRKGTFHPDVILDQIAKMSQSNQLVFLQGKVKVNFLHSVEPNGGGVGQGVQLSDDPVFMQNKRCMLSLGKWASEDDNCLPRALVLACAYLLNPKDGVRLHRSELEQRIAISTLCRNAGVPKDQRCGLPELQLFSGFLSDYNIRVYTDRLGREVMFEGNPLIKEKHRRISLYYSRKTKHYAVIRSMEGFTGKSAYCFDCRQAYNTKGHHVCKSACRKCYKEGVGDCCPVQQGYQRKCSVCQFSFYNQDCFTTHQKRPFFTKGRTVCEVRQFCTTCLVSVNVREKRAPHDCDKFYCSNCKETVTREGHVCTIQKKETLLQRERRKAIDKAKKKKKAEAEEVEDSSEEEEEQEENDSEQAGPSRGPGPKGKKSKKKKFARPFVYVAFDLETRQEKKRDDGSWEHEANLCVSHTACLDCMNEHDMTKACTYCGQREQIFYGNDCVTQFMSYLFNSEALRQFKQVIAIAHNLSGFDGSFILSYLCDRPDTGLGPPTFIQRGTKLINICYGGRFKFVDSLNFLPMALSKLPKALDLGADVAKGYFCHFFNREVNQGFVGDMPPPEDYGVDKMSVGDRAKFEKWYAEQAGKKFDFDKELVKYCISDVDVLRRAVVKFRALWLETAEIDPFRECNTLAGACMLNYQANYLTPNSICIIPRGGFFGNDIQSKAAVEWLRYLSHSMGVDIQHAQNSREHKAGKYKLDGFIPGKGAQKPKALEFHGCWYHGHPDCFPFQTAAVSDTETMGDRFKRTLEKRERLEALGYQVVEMWGCQWERMKKEDPNVQAFLKDHPVDYEEPLNPRDCFYGGRCNNVKRYVKVTDGQKIHYVDVTSLYPFINKFGKYVLGAPTRKVYPDCPHPDQFEGLIKLTILPPQDLYHPVLPLHMHDKLMFILCRTCGEECKYDSQETCNHTPEERMIKGSWVVDEVRKALEVGYKIVKIHECWVFDAVTKFDPSGKDGDPATSGLFAKYVNANLKLKTEASGWPPNVKTHEEQEAFLKDQLSKGVRLERKNMIKNPGLRAVAKLCLNSLWGRFAMGSNLKKTVMVTEAQKHYELLSNPAIRVHSILPINEEVEIMTYDYQEEEIPTSLNTNVVIAAYTTALARLELYKYLEKVQEDALYFDTDSLIYLERPGITEKIKIGNDLGEMTDELHDHGGPNSYATHFVSGGPKVYGLRIAHGGDINNCSTIIKVKGVSMNSGNKDLVNFEQLCKLVLGEIEPIRIDSKRDIRRAKHYKVVSRDTHKYLRPVYTKRRWAPNHDSVPYGFKRRRIDDSQEV